MSGRRLELDAGATRLAVETEIDELRVPVLHAAALGAAPFAPRAAHLENIGKVVVEGEREQEAHPLVAEIPYRKAVKQRGAPDEDRPRHVQHVFVQDDVLVVIDIGVCEIDGEDAVVVGEVRAEQERLKPVDQQLEMRQVTGIATEQAVRPARRRADVAMAVEHHEAVVLLHGEPRPCRWLGRRDIERNVR